MLQDSENYVIRIHTSNSGYFIIKYANNRYIINNYYSKYR